MTAAHKPDDKSRKQVTTCVEAGIDQEVISDIIGIAPKTLRKHYSTEIRTAKALATTDVAGALKNNALDGNVTAQIFWMKTQGKWRETDTQLIIAEKVESITYIGEDASNPK